MSRDKLVQYAHDLRALKTQKEELEGQLKTVNAQLTELTTKTIPEALQDQEVPRLTVDGVGTLYLQTEVYAFVPAEQRDAFYDWLRMNGHGDLIKDTVHPGTLKAWAKEQLSEGIALPDELVKATLVPTARLKKGS
jgi:hypothetical protein